MSRRLGVCRAADSRQSRKVTPKHPQLCDAQGSKVRRCCGGLYRFWRLGRDGSCYCWGWGWGCICSCSWGRNWGRSCWWCCWWSHNRWRCCWRGCCRCRCRWRCGRHPTKRRLDPVLSHLLGGAPSADDVFCDRLWPLVLRLVPGGVLQNVRGGRVRAADVPGARCVALLPSVSCKRVGVRAGKPAFPACAAASVS